MGNLDVSCLPGGTNQAPDLNANLILTLKPGPDVIGSPGVASGKLPLPSPLPMSVRDTNVVPYCGGSSPAPLTPKGGQVRSKSATSQNMPPGGQQEGGQIQLTLRETGAGLRENETNMNAGMGAKSLSWSAGEMENTDWSTQTPMAQRVDSGLAGGGAPDVHVATSDRHNTGGANWRSRQDASSNRKAPGGSNLGSSGKFDYWGSQKSFQGKGGVVEYRFNGPRGASGSPLNKTNSTLPTSSLGIQKHSALPPLPSSAPCRKPPKPPKPPRPPRAPIPVPSGKLHVGMGAGGSLSPRHQRRRESEGGGSRGGGGQPAGRQRRRPMIGQHGMTTVLALLLTLLFGILVVFQGASVEPAAELQKRQAAEETKISLANQRLSEEVFHQSAVAVSVASANRVSGARKGTVRPGGRREGPVVRDWRMGKALKGLDGFSEREPVVDGMGGWDAPNTTAVVGEQVGEGDEAWSELAQTHLAVDSRGVGEAKAETLAAGMSDYLPHTE